MTSGPILLRCPGRRFFRRLVVVGALAATLFVAPGAGGVPGPGEPPDVTPLYLASPGANGWYVSNVTLSWRIETDPGTPILNSSPECNVRTFATETPGVTVTCWAENAGGRTTVTTKAIKIDKTPPAVSILLERQADANGWYNRPLTVGFTGTDVTAGVAGCSSSRYAGPDTAGVSLPGSCIDNAGNLGASSFSLKYDATPPTLVAAAVKPGNRSAEISWRASSDTRVVEVVRAPGRNGQGETVVYRGSATGWRDTGLSVGRRYEYRIRAFDEAANRAEITVKLIATGALLSPAPGARISLKRLPTLVWTPVRKATYYNLQLVRGHRVLSAWPVRPGFRLRRTWTYRGRRHRLQPGVYRWYVWPGRGRISAGRYGRLLGSSTFVVMR